MFACGVERKALSDISVLLLIFAIAEKLGALPGGIGWFEEILWQVIQALVANRRPALAFPPVCAAAVDAANRSVTVPMDKGLFIAGASFFFCSDGEPGTKQVDQPH